MILIISIIFYMVLFLFNKKLGFVYYQLFAATTYLISLSFIQTLDLTLTLYLCFSVLPYIKYFKVDSIHKFILLLFFLLHLIVSSIMNNPFNALSIFIIRLSGLFVYIFIFKNVDDECIIYEKSNRKLAFLFLLCEVIIFIIGFLLSPDGRLMLNFQCTVGCIATSSMILLSYYLLNDTNDRFFVFIAMFLLTLISCLSGTRGYIIICVVILSLNIIFYCSIKEKILFSFLGFLICLFKYKDILDMILIKSRFGESTGRRNIENSFIIKLMFRGPLHRLLLGNGFGTPANVDLILLPSRKASEYYKQKCIKYNSNHCIFPLVFTDELNEINISEKKYFSFISTSSNSKNFNKFIEYIKHRSKTDSTALFQISTRTDISSYIDAELKQLVNEKRLIINHGHSLSNTEINEAYSKANCTWMLYSRSTQSGVLCKAFMFGSPVIASDIGSFKEFVNGENGLILENGYSFEDINTAYDKIKKNLDGYSENARNTFLKEFYWKNKAEYFKKILV